MYLFQVKVSKAGTCHGIALWIDWVMDSKSSIVISTGPGIAFTFGLNVSFDNKNGYHSKKLKRKLILTLKCFSFHHELIQIRDTGNKELSFLPTPWQLELEAPLMASNAALLSSKHPSIHQRVNST